MTDEPRRSAEKVLAEYAAKGLAGEMGFGRRPALLVVDLILGFTRVSSPLGSDLDAVVEATRRLLDSARSMELPIFFTTTFYNDDLRDAGLFVLKVPSLAVLVEGSEEVDLDPRLERRPQETLIEKKYASAFFGTALASELTALSVDTLIVSGATTSGCIRATAVDALQHGFRPIVPAECVGDRSPEAHRANLLDIQGKYGDVVELGEVLTYIKGLSTEGGD